MLSSSQGNILEDATAIQVLSDAKVLADEISEKELVAEQTRAEIDQARVSYSTCGQYNARLFFCIASLAGVDPMYQYSLRWFTSLFVRSIKASEAADDVARRLEHINAHFTLSLYRNVCRSLFERDKLMFSFLLATTTQLGAGAITPEQYGFFLTGGVGLTAREIDNPAEAWIPPKAWADVACLHHLESPGFRGIALDIAA